MASSIASQSRLGLTLQGYDQVIALSQANINESLDYHYASDEKLLDFEVIHQGTGINGRMSTPTIGLDEFGAEKAILRLNFESGEFFWTVSVENSSDSLERMSVPIAGWFLSFEVSFSTRRLNEPDIPNHVKSAIQTPGKYTINQLLIDLGSLSNINILWDHCHTPSLPAGSSIDSRSRLYGCVEAYIYKLRQEKNESIILGYAATVDLPGQGQSKDSLLEGISAGTPSFPPTSLRLQTINHRPDGDRSKASVEDDHNAFLFTEMTNYREMPQNHLEWSGDWFYDNIGGTLAMSHRIFVDEYLAKALGALNAESWRMANQFYVNLSGRSDGWHFDKPLPRSEQMPMEAGNKVSLTFKDHDKTHFGEPKEGWLGFSGMNVVGETETAIENNVGIRPGGGVIEVSSMIDFDLRLGYQLPFGYYGLGINVRVTWDAKIKMKAIENGGRLLAEVEVSEPEVRSHETERYEDKLIDAISEVRELVLKQIHKGMGDTNAFVIQQAANANSLKTIQGTLEHALNGQGRFIFPGGGTFDMKDPVFTEAGDLLIGLTYQKGA